MSAKSAGKKPRVNEHDIARARAAICPALPVLSSSGPLQARSAAMHGRLPEYLADSPSQRARPSAKRRHGAAQSRADEKEPTTRAWF
jgi:hypothetical protein